MNIRHARDLALKLLGIYYLSHALIYAPQLCSLFATWDGKPEYAPSKLAIAVSVLLPLAFWLAVGAVLTFRTGSVAAFLWPKTEPDEPMPPGTKTRMAFWIVLIAFFYFVGALGGTVAELWIFAADRQMRGSWTQYKFLPDLITLVLSVICIVKARAIESWLQQKIGEDSQHPAAPYSEPAARSPQG